MTQILDGKFVADQIKAEVRAEIDASKATPILDIVLCNEEPASRIYVDRKIKACREVGIKVCLWEPLKSEKYFPTTPLGILLNLLEHLNKSKSCGVLVQLPLPKDINCFDVFDKIDPIKDVDVFSPVNVGLLLQGRPRFIPCTPQGIQELLVRHGIEIEGKRVCIINRSEIVGKPLHALLIQKDRQANATVTLCHDFTPPERLKEACLNSDIIVVAVGIPGFLKAEMVPHGAIVVDVGINRLSSGKIVGDVDFEPVSQKTSWISTVPGGCGLTTVACLLRNVVKAWHLKNSD